MICVVCTLTQRADFFSSVPRVGTASPHSALRYGVTVKYSTITV